MSRLRQPRLTLALAALLWGSLGVTCEDFVSNPTSTDLPISLKVELEKSYPWRNGYVVGANLMVTAREPVQACDLTLSWKTGNVGFAAAFPHRDFDDDGVLFADGQLGPKSFAHIVDVRHGAATTTGSVRVAVVALIVNGLAPIKLTLGGECAASDGEPFQVVISESLTVAPGS